MHTFKRRAMKKRREFEIAFVGLKPGAHEFYYDIDDEFFEDYQEQDFRNCVANVKVTLQKNINSLMRLKFEVGGHLELNCDRCGNDLKLDLWDEFNIVVKLVDEPEVMNDQEEDPDIYYISKHASHLFLADWIYEFINLSIPMQRICAVNEKGEPGCDSTTLEALEKMRKKAEEEAKPIWKGLEKFKNLGK